MSTSVQTTSLSIRGMHCIACVRRVERALTSIAGVVATKVDLIAGKAVVEFDPSRATEAALKEAVRQVGYRVAD